MAKELPYFQFEPAEYMAGSIQFCSLEAQGLFINICCLYWQRSCELTIEQINKRFQKPELLNDLINQGIIDVSLDKIEIIFLKRSYKKHQSISKKNSINGKLSAESRRIKRSQGMDLSGVNDRLTTVEQPLNDRTNELSTIREDKIIVNKIKEKEKKEKGFSADDFVKKINEIYSRHYRVSAKVKEKFNARVNSGDYSIQTLIDVANHIKLSTYHIGTQFNYATPEFILREDTIEKYKHSPIIQQNNTLFQKQPTKPPPKFINS